jgi:hypothetical protein
MEGPDFVINLASASLILVLVALFYLLLVFNTSVLESIDFRMVIAKWGERCA